MMTQSLRQLIRKILQALEGELPRSELQQLAEDYAATCRRTNERLDQLATVIAKGSLYSALQLAEVEPPVMDIVAQLNFAQSQQWRDYCIEHRLPVPERMNESAILQIRELYKNENLDAAYLYREYRSCILQKNQLGALRCLRAILRINPSDNNAKEEFMRLQLKHQGSALQELESALEKEDGERVLTLMDEIESLPDMVSEDHPVWTKALSLRRRFQQQRNQGYIKELEEEIRQLSRDGKYEVLLARKRAWDQLQAEMGYPENAASRQELTDLAAIAEEKINELKKQQEQEAIAEKWFIYLKEVEAKLRAGISNPECREAYQQLVGFRKELLVAGAVADEELEEASRKAESALLRKLSLRRRKKLLFAGTAVLAVLIAVAAILLAYEHKEHRAKSVVLMSEALQDKNLNDVERLLEAWSHESDSFQNHPEILALKKEASVWLEREKTNESAVAEIHRRLLHYLSLGKGELAQIRSNLKDERDLWEQLHPASQERLRFDRQKVNQTWDTNRSQWLNEDQQELQRLTNEFNALWEKSFAKILSPEDLGGDLSLANDLVVRAQEIRKRVDILMDTKDPSLQQFWDQAQARVAELTEQVAVFQEGSKLLADNQSLESFRYGITLLAGLPFDSESMVAAAKVVATTINQWSEPQKALLRAAGEFALPDSSVHGSIRFYPERLSPSENVQLRDLFEHSIVTKLYRYDIQNYRGGSLLKGTEVIYSLGELETDANPHGDREEVVQVVKMVTPITLQKSPYYEEVVYLATRLLHNKNWRDGSALVKGTRPIEAQFLEQLKSQLDYQPDTGRIGRSLLYALDDLFKQNNIDPIFRAWVFGELIQVALNRPEEWGIVVTPALLRDWERLQRVFDGIPSIADWLDPNRSAHLRPVTQAFFQTPSVPSYVRQATFQVQLANSLGTSRWEYYGYVNTAGRIAQMKGNVKSGKYLWGLEAFRGQWAPLFQNRKDSWVNQASPQPLTPLFVFSEDLGQFVLQASKRAGIESENELQVLREYLPAYFR